MTLDKLNEIKSSYKVLEIAVDFINPSYNISRAKRLDNSRYIVCTLTENGVPRAVKTNEAARIRLQKPDRTYVYNDCEPIDDGRVLITLTEQILAAEGNAVCDIQLTNEDTGIIYSTKNFIINIDKTAVDNSVIESSDEFDALNNLIAANKKLNDEIKADENLRQSNEKSRQNAEAERATAETARTANENKRIISENIREQNETVRQNQEAERQSNTAAAVAKAENAAKSADDAAKDLLNKLDAHHFVLTEDKGAAGGVADLDTNTKIPITELYDATTSSKGVVQLTDSITSTSAATAATANSVKTAYEESKLYTDSKITDLINSGEFGSTDISELLDKKVDKVTGKDLSTNDYTTSEKDKLSGIAAGATKNTASATIPKANGTASAGTESGYARGDHVHPTQTSITGNAATATKLATSRNLNGMNFDGSADRANYGVCSTAAATAAKTVSCEGFRAVTGAEIAVFFTVTNTAANPTLNVNSTGAKPIYYRGAAIAAGYLANARLYTFRLTGECYTLVGDINTNTTYSNMVGATASAAGKAGLVPAPTSGTNTMFLSGSGTWQPSLTVQNILTASTNLNSYLTPGLYYFGSNYTPANAPAGVINGYLSVISVSDANIRQIWYRYGTVNTNDHETYTRAYNGTTWSTWSKYITSKDTASLTICYQGSGSSVTKTLPAGKTKCLIIAYWPESSGISCGSYILTGLSSSMTAITNPTALFSSGGPTLLYTVTSAGAITLHPSKNFYYTMIYFA